VKTRNPGGNRGLTFGGRLSAAPGFLPAAAWGAIPHVSTQTVTGETVAPCPAGLPEKIRWRLQ